MHTSYQCKRVKALPLNSLYQFIIPETPRRIIRCNEITQPKTSASKSDLRHSIEALHNEIILGWYSDKQNTQEKIKNFLGNYIQIYSTVFGFVTPYCHLWCIFLRWIMGNLELALTLSRFWKPLNICRVVIEYFCRCLGIAIFGTRRHDLFRWSVALDTYLRSIGWDQNCSAILAICKKSMKLTVKF
jgi:hypothetical protein